MQDEWIDRLSEYLDGELTDEERHAMESHLAGCPRCAATLDELRQVVDRARSMGPRPPQADLWPAIADRIATPGWPAAPKRASAKAGARPPRRFSFTLAQLAAAAVLLVAISSAVAWQVTSRSAKASRYGEGARYGESARYWESARRTDNATVAVPPVAGEGSAIEGEASFDRSLRPVSLADAQYDAAVADLERALAKGRGRLDKTTIAIVEENLTIIDRAIAQAREALAADPANSYLSGHLIEARRKKLDLLRRATALTSDTN